MGVCSACHRQTVEDVGKSDGEPRGSKGARGVRASGGRVKHQGETLGKPLTRLACGPVHDQASGGKGAVSRDGVG
jgi:hypothetical protein